MKGLTYKEAGVDIDAGNRAVELIKEKVRKTMRPEVLTDIGGFGGLFALDISKYRQPVLVSGTDGVGTKLRVAMLMDKHDTIGIDCVAMCVNDILVQGAEPLFFLDYLAVGKLEPEQVAAIVGGIAEGCREAGCALIGGETAEMPGFYPPGEYDVAGFAVGVVDKEKILDGSRVREGMTVLGLASHGLHSNGYSLARKVLLERAGLNLDLYLPELGCTVGEELLKPTRIYIRSLLPLVQEGRIAALAHITGGGLLENIPRVLPPGLGVELTAGSWPIPPIFDLIEKLGHIAKEEMARTFNLGIGMVAIVAAEEAPTIADRLTAAGEKVYTIGRVVAGAGVQVV